MRAAQWLERAGKDVLADYVYDRQGQTWSAHGPKYSILPRIFFAQRPVACGKSGNSGYGLLGLLGRTDLAVKNGIVLFMISTPCLSGPRAGLLLDSASLLVLPGTHRAFIVPLYRSFPEVSRDDLPQRRIADYQAPLRGSGRAAGGVGLHPSIRRLE